MSYSTDGSCLSPPAPPPPFKIEAVTTSVGCADFLAHTLPLNIAMFDRLVVVTAPWDEATRKVCDHYRVRYVETNEFVTKHGEFKKGQGINKGLAALDKDCWIVHLDSDIVLPSHFRDVLKNADLDTSMVYGVDRAEFKSYEDWQAFHGAPEPQVQGNGVFIHTTNTGKQLGTRVMFANRGGYVPIGFFQLWHAHSKVKKYPEGHTTAGREDSLFGSLWPRKKRGFIPEIIVYHLESEEAPMAVNWAGRKTKPFKVQQ